jgi:septum formation protein
VTPTPDIVLASSSPRRQAILAAAGIRFEVLPPAMDDALLPVSTGDPARLTMGLAWFKARQVLSALAARGGAGAPRLVLAADTVCVVDGRIVGKPADPADARRMVCALEGRTHDVVTGLCIADRRTGGRTLLADRAAVTLGVLPAGELDRYVAGGGWQGKSGGYNYSERLSAGWSLSCAGDPETVMGLPSRLVLPLLAAFGRAA